MKIARRIPLLLATVLISLWLFVGAVAAEPETSIASPPETATLARSETATSPGSKVEGSIFSDSFREKLELLRQDKQLQRLVEEDLEKSIAIREQIEVEVDRAFGHTTTLLNVLLVLLTALPILAAIGIWFIRRSVISQIAAETKQQLQAEVEKQLEAEVAAEFKKQAEAFQREIEGLKSAFVARLSKLKLDAQNEKDKIIWELSRLIPSSIRETVNPEIQQKIQELTDNLEQLKANNPELFFTASDYIEQGKAFYFEGRYEEAIASHNKAIQIESDNPRAWFGKGAALTKLQQYDEAIAAYDRATQLKPEFSEAKYGRGAVLTKLQQYDDAIAAYDRVIEIKPDFYLAWVGKARCYALQDNADLALLNLEKAIYLNADKCKETAKTDASFDKIREDERFQALIEH